MWYPILVTVLVGYLLGNLNGAVSMSVLFANDDVRSHGSGNAGLTNFIRNFGAAKGLLVIAIDVGKAVLSCMLGGLLLKPYGYELEGMMLGAIGVSLGHDFPATLGFRGGKGVLCGLAIALTLDWRVAALICVVFFGLYLLTGYVSLGSVMAAVAFGAGFAFFHWGNWYLVAGGIFLGGMVLFMHRENIKRLLSGTERKSNLLGKGKIEE